MLTPANDPEPLGPAPAFLVALWPHDGWAMLSRAPTLARDLGTDLRVARVTTGQEAFRQIRAWLREVDDATA